MPASITIVIATKNKGKVSEIQNIVASAGIQIKSVDEFGPISSIIEDGKTFEENAYKKASLTARMLGFPALADDSGLLVEALDGAPGIYSARYGGHGLTDIERCELLLEKLKGKTDRRACFECVLSLAVPQGAALTYEAKCEGLIHDKIEGNKGFGYDPIFFFPPLNKTFAQLSQDEKNQVSHRGKALIEFKSELSNIIKWLEIHTP